MFERFTARAREVVIGAQDEARALRHNYIGTEHILLGLLRVEEGLAARVLESLGVTIDRVREQVVRIVGPGEETISGQIPFTPRAKKVLELSLREALSLGQNHIGPEHLLLGLVREGEGVAGRILLDFDADPEKIRREVIRVLSGPTGRPPAGAARTANPLRPPLDWENAGILWRPDRILRAAIRECEHLTSRVLREQLGLRVARVGPEAHPTPVRRAPHVSSNRARPAPVASPPPEHGLHWQRATVLWRPEGLELRIPLRMDEPAIAAFATDEIWHAPPLNGVRREIWHGWLALASPTLLDDLDPDVLRPALDAAANRALHTDDPAPDRLRDFLHRLRSRAPQGE